MEQQQQLFFHLSISLPWPKYRRYLSKVGLSLSFSTPIYSYVLVGIVAMGSVDLSLSLLARSSLYLLIWS